MLRALARDELVIKATRVDVLYGVTNLMDTAMLASSGTPGNILFLYGKQDDIIPAQPTCELLERLSNGSSAALTAIVYEQGYHMLTRDLQGPAVIQDIAAWIAARETPRHAGDDMRNYCTQHGGPN
jgi:alpha-beta hydrolase superfamily lysophospholipase